MPGALEPGRAAGPLPPEAFDLSLRVPAASLFLETSLTSPHAMTNGRDPSTETLTFPDSIFEAPTIAELTIRPVSGAPIVTPLTCKPWGFRSVATAVGNEDPAKLVDPTIDPDPDSKLF